MAGTTYSSSVLWIKATNISCLGTHYNLWLINTYEVCDELTNVVVHDSLGDPKVNAFDAKLTKLAIHMKH
jgi:hypothetical protein